MKILIIANQILSEKRLKAIIQNNHPDIIFCLGHLNTSCLKVIKDSHIPCYGVLSDKDKVSLDEYNIKNIHGKIEEFNQIKIMGNQFTPKYKGNPFEQSSDFSLSFFQKLAPCDIFISRCPALGINDNPSNNAHQGLEGIKQYLINNKVYLFFHTHSSPPKSQYISRINETYVYFVDNMLLVDTTKLPEIETLPLASSYIDNIDEEPFNLSSYQPNTPRFSTSWWSNFMSYFKK